jgi:hypothetical protein
MKLTHEHMMRATAEMPMKLIRVNDEPYLERYYAGRFSDGYDLWLHHFVSADADRHVHSHPFVFFTVMLLGSYTEDLGDNEVRITTPAGIIDWTLDKHLHRMRCQIKECHRMLLAHQ